MVEFHPPTAKIISPNPTIKPSHFRFPSPVFTSQRKKSRKEGGVHGGGQPKAANVMVSVCMAAPAGEADADVCTNPRKENRW
ncbi:UNVERIFIED_CONTAM: hypothetical protein Sradi_6878100 [Sesamum radiatum]|uniref:Uncharacterized protein n=1 Tax=Sesamum radiatum TaxID=300843 RepID=A0AAW2JJF8_SESRA